MSGLYKTLVDRRTTLKWFTVASAAAMIPGAVFGNSRMQGASSGYGTDPDLMDPVVPWQKSMTARQLNIVAKLCDIILPADDVSPAASEIGIPDFIDEWVSAPYPNQKSDNKIILSGLDLVDKEARKRFGKGFSEISDEQRHVIFEKIVAGPALAQEDNKQTFFYRLRYLTVGAFYTTEVGFKDIGYIGNVALDSFPGPTKESMSILDVEMTKLGL